MLIFLTKRILLNTNIKISIVAQIAWQKAKFLRVAFYYILTNTGRSKWRKILLNYMQKSVLLALRERCPYSEFFWSVISRIQTEDGEIRRISPYSVQMRDKMDQKNFKCGHFSRSVKV